MAATSFMSPLHLRELICAAHTSTAELDILLATPPGEGLASVLAVRRQVWSAASPGPPRSEADRVSSDDALFQAFSSNSREAGLRDWRLGIADWGLAIGDWGLLSERGSGRRHGVGGIVKGGLRVTTSLFSARVSPFRYSLFIIRD